MTQASNKSSSTIVLQVLSIPLLMLSVIAVVFISAGMVGVTGGMFGGKTHDGTVLYGLAAVATFLSLWLILGAIFAYLNVGQRKKIQIITGFYSPETIAEYFEQFWSGRDGIPALVKRYRDFKKAALKNDEQEHALDVELSEKLMELFRDDFGLRVYIIPIILLITTASIALFFAYAGGIGLALGLAAGKPSPLQPLGITLDLVSIAAIFGAYTWVASDAIVRNHQWTLHPSDLTWYALRFIIAIPLGEALALTVGGQGTGVLPTGAGAFVAFVASMFSLDSITRALGTAATRFGVQLKSSYEERDDLIVKLAGVDEDKARALSVEGVSTIAQLVTVDPVRISIRTGLSFEYILNLIDAALLWVFVGNSLKALNPLGLLGASDVLGLAETWRKRDASTAALDALRRADTALDLARQSEAAAQAQPGADPAAIAPLTQAVVSAVAARAEALDAFAAAAVLQPSPVPDRAAMLTALAVGTAAGGPGLTAIGFDTIAADLGANSYALFIRNLIIS